MSDALTAAACVASVSNSTHLSFSVPLDPMSAPLRRCFGLPCARRPAGAGTAAAARGDHRRRPRRRPRHRGAAARAAPSGGDHNSGAWVFPGGIVDAARPRRACAPATASTTPRRARRLGARERRPRLLRRRDPRVLRGSRACCSPRRRRPRRCDLDGEAADRLRALARRAAPARARHRRDVRAARACASRPIALVYLSHWLTPLGRPSASTRASSSPRRRRRRRPSHDGTEMVEQLLDRARPRRSRAASR